MKTLFYIAGFLFVSLASFATGGDTTKVKYDLNDPRNPDCPCHQYQKQADEEYQRMLANDAIQTASENVADLINKTKEKTAPDLLANAAKDAGANRTENTDDINTNKAKEKTAPVPIAIGITATAAGNADAKTVKDSNKTTETKKVNKSAFRHRSGSHHSSTKPKKRKIRFGRKDNSRCTHW
jgi:hypothetical protein